jgi:hypothetical protein
LFPTATSRREVSREVAVPIPTGPNLGGETNNGGTAKLFRKAHLVEIWDGHVRQLGQWQGFQVKRKRPGFLPLTIAEVRMQCGKIHGIALAVLGAILFGVLMPIGATFALRKKQTKPKSVSNCTEVLLPASYVAAYA